MLRDPAAKRYAQAAFQLARDKGELDAWESGLRALGETLQTLDAMVFLSSVRVPDVAKQEFLRRVMEQPAPLLWNLVLLLIERSRLALTPQIIQEFMELLDDERGIAHAQVTTAVPMSDSERTAVAARLSELTGKQVQIETHEDPEMLGGLVARVGDRLIDGSTRTKLIALKRQLAGSTR